MQPPKIGSKVTPEELAGDVHPADTGTDRQTATDRKTAWPASEENADTDSAGELADTQEAVVDRGLTRLPPG